MPRANNRSVQPEHWFADKEPPLLFYKINRRPRAQTNLFAEQPDSFFDHVAEALLFGGDPVITGGKNQREWRLGNRDIDLDNALLAGQLGWLRSHTSSADRYDEESATWRDVIDEIQVSARSAFVIDGQTRLLAVLRHPTFGEMVLPSVFNELLNRGEDSRAHPTTDWDVEPLLDEKEFRQWLDTTNSVQSVTFVAKLPNPDALEEFEPIYSRMKNVEASQLNEKLLARDAERGLKNLQTDPTSKALIAMASAAFGYILAKGIRGTRPTRYDQRQKVARERVGPLEDNWATTIEALKERLLRRRSK